MRTLAVLAGPLLFIIFCTPVYSTQHYSIVFVHIGNSIPAYATVALSQARDFNPEASIVLLANQEALLSFDCSSNVTCVACESLQRSPDHEEFLAQTSLDSQSRDGFWLYASERFLYLADYIAQYDLKNVFHLEYDNMLYSNLEASLPIFQSHYPGIAATFDNDIRCIPGFVYVNNPTPMERLAKCFSAHAKEGLNDMQILALFKSENSAGVIDNLPIITEEYINEHALISPSGHVAAQKSDYAKNIDSFQSIFDAAALGQFLGGIDPRNGDSSPGFINESCVFNPSLINIEWIVDDERRKVPYVVYPHAKYRINNLHIHSKRLELFKSKEAL